MSRGKLTAGLAFMVLGLFRFPAPAHAETELLPFFGKGELHAAVTTRAFYGATPQYLRIAVPGIYYFDPLGSDGRPMETSVIKPSTVVFMKPKTAAETIFTVSATTGKVNFLAEYKTWAKGLMTMAGFPHGVPYSMQGRGDLTVAINEATAILFGGSSTHGADAYYGIFTTSYVGFVYSNSPLKITYRELIEATRTEICWWNSCLVPFPTPKRFVAVGLDTFIYGKVSARTRLEYLSPAWDVDIALIVAEGQFRVAIGWRQENHILFPGSADHNLYAELGAAF